MADFEVEPLGTAGTKQRSDRKRDLGRIITAVERQVFDFLGYQWAPILVNFLHVIVLILSVFGAVNYKPRYLILYAVWSALWVTWNIFICFFYLDLGGLSKDSDYLSMGLSPYRSWWKDNFPNCDNPNLRTTRWQLPDGPDLISDLGCVLKYQHIEVFHSVVQLTLSVVGFVFSCYIISIFNEEDNNDTYFYK